MVPASLPEDGRLLGPIEVKGRILEGGPHAVLVRENDLSLIQLPGRSRLWLAVIPGVILAWTLQPYLPDGLPETTTYIVLVILAFYAGDRWSNHVTQHALEHLTPEEAAREADARIHLHQLLDVDTDELLLGDREITLVTSQDQWRLEVPDEHWPTLQRILHEHLEGGGPTPANP